MSIRILLIAPSFPKGEIRGSLRVGMARTPDSGDPGGAPYLRPFGRDVAGGLESGRGRGHRRASPDERRPGGTAGLRAQELLRNHFGRSRSSLAMMSLAPGLQ